MRDNPGDTDHESRVLVCFFAVPMCVLWTCSLESASSLFIESGKIRGARKGPAQIPL